MSDAAQEELLEVVQDPEGQLGVAEGQAEEADEDVDQEAVVEVAQADAASEAALIALFDVDSNKQWMRIAMRVTEGESAAEAWNAEVIGADLPTDEVMTAGIADALARMTRTLLTGAQYDIEPEGGQQAQRAGRVPKKFKEHDDKERTPADQLASLHRQAEIALTNSTKLSNIQQSGDKASTKAMRTIVLARTQEVALARAERELGQARSRAERQKYTLTKTNQANELLQAMCSIDVDSLDVTGDAALLPGCRDSASHPFLDGDFGDFYAAEPTGQAVLTRNIENTVRYFKRRNATYCAYCRRSINLEVGKIFTCKACLSTLYCGENCGVRHKTEHRPVCKVHEGWNMEAREAAGAVGWGVTAGYAIGGEAAPTTSVKQEVIVLDVDEALPGAQEGSKGAKGKGGKGGKGTKGAKGAKGAKGGKAGKGKKRKRATPASQSESYHSGGSWDGGWKDTRCFNCWETGHIASDCPRNHDWY